MTREEQIQRLDELNGFYYRLVDLYEDMSGNRTDIILTTYVIRTTENNYTFNNSEDFINTILDEMKELFKF